ncbi:MAG: hypothetical protein ACTSV2_19990 [Candidatus Thorarchaeota archaeon]
MFRTITALAIALVIAVVIGAFQILGLSIETIQSDIINAPDVTNVLMLQGGALFMVLLQPYTSAMTGLYAPLVALGVAGFVAGLISKSGARMLIVSAISLGIFFLGYAVLSMGASLSVDVLAALAETILIDLGVAFGLLFIPGVIGASLTSEDY